MLARNLSKVTGWKNGAELNPRREWLPVILGNDWVAFMYAIPPQTQLDSDVYDQALYRIHKAIEVAVLSEGGAMHEFKAFIVSERMKEIPPIFQEGILRLSYECRGKFLDEWNIAKTYVIESMNTKSIDPYKYLHGLI